jgi:hypothetical protein
MKPKQRRDYPAAAMAYAHVLPRLQALANKHGYAIALHGSMATDLDLLACPWTAEAIDALEIAVVVRDAVNGHFAIYPDGCTYPTQKPHGRLSWLIYFNKDAAVMRHGLYIDLSVMPRIMVTKQELN